MERLTETEVRASFVNATKGEIARMNLPPDLDQQPWAELDLLGWVDPKAPLSGYLVAPMSERGGAGQRRFVRFEGLAGGRNLRTYCAQPRP